MISALIAYNFQPKKPSLNLEIVDLDKLKLIAQVELRLITFLFTGNVFSQKIGIVYNTDEWVYFTYLKGVAYSFENEYNVFNVIDYCSNTLKSEFPEVTEIDVRPSNMVSMNKKAKDICKEQNLDYVVLMVHTPIHPDQALGNRIKFKLGEKSFGLTAHSMNKKIYYIFFNTVFRLYSNKTDKLLSFEKGDYKTFEHVREKENIIEDVRGCLKFT